MQLFSNLVRKYRAYRYKRRSKRANPARLISGRPVDRLLGLEEVLAQARGKTVLDIGCHDGSVAEAFARAGAARIDGCDISRLGVEMANARVPLVQPASTFHVTDLSKGPSALEALPLLPKYDIVCYLGMHHHLSGQMTRAALEQLTAAILDRSDSVFVARTPLIRFDDLHQLIITAGFTPVDDLMVTGKVGPSRVYQRSAR